MRKFPLATIPATDERIVKALSVDQEYMVSVALPYHYHENQAKTYPVIYVLDGNWYFGMVVDMVRIMNTRTSFCNELPDAIIVGIGYPNGETFEEKYHQVGQRRMRDFTAMRDEGLEQWHHITFPIEERMQSGGADKFLAFIKDELLPLIESEYRADANNRCLLGHSLGGFFGLHTVFKQPTLFHKYVIASPAEIYENEPWFTESAVILPVRMYLSAGEAELYLDEIGNTRPYSSFQRLAERLESCFADETALVKQIFPKLTHCAVATPAFQAGLVAVLP